jgi:hypothetical protein
MDNEILEELKKLTKAINTQNRLLTKIAKSMYLVPMTDKESERLELEKRKNAAQAMATYEKVEDRSNSSEDSYTMPFGNFPEDNDVFEDVIADDLR